MTAAVVGYILVRWAELKGRCRDFRKRLAAEVKRFFGVEISGEWLRQLCAEPGRVAVASVAADSASGEGLPPAPVDEVPSVGVVAPEGAASRGEDPSLPASGGSHRCGCRRRGRAARFRWRSQSPLAVEVAVETSLPHQYAGVGGDGAMATSCPGEAQAEAASSNQSPALSPKMRGVDGEKRATSCSPEPEMSLENELPSNLSPSLPLCGSLPLGLETVGPRPELAHHVGQLLFAPILATALPGAGALRDACLRWGGQILQGAVNIEQTKGLALADLSRFTGVPPLCAKEQRLQLWELATSLPHAPLEIYDANARIVRLGPLDGNVFYYDPHVKEYTGTAPIPKGWCARIHATAKIIALDCLHTPFGDPILVQHFDNYFDLRERVLIVVATLRSRFPGALVPITLVIDRGAYGLECFDRLLAESIHLITWEKGYDRRGWIDGAPTATFTFTRPRNNSADLLEYRVAFQSAPWSRESRFTRIIARVTSHWGKTFEASILNSDPLITDEDAVRKILNRWLQENDFKYLDHHVGLMQITTYAMIPYAKLPEKPPDRPAESEEFRDLCRSLKETRSQLAKELLLRETILDKRKSAAAQADRAQTEAQSALRELNRRRGGATTPLESSTLARCASSANWPRRRRMPKKMPPKRSAPSPPLTNGSPTSKTAPTPSKPASTASKTFSAPSTAKTPAYASSSPKASPAPTPAPKPSWTPSASSPATPSAACSNASAATTTTSATTTPSSANSPVAPAPSRSKTAPFVSPSGNAPPCRPTPGGKSKPSSTNSATPSTKASPTSPPPSK
ncbi:MAG: hypothetical protein HC901_03975 [Bdellovibrionaceae bacterium]|nr:hypothetical protein [Pseudobdellovibrionaceae bacterium]